MYHGHLAVGLLIATVWPDAPPAAVLHASAALDYANAFNVAAGLDAIRPNPSKGPYLFCDLDWIDYDHSLLMAFVIATVWSIFYSGKDRLPIWLSVFLHWPADYLVHEPTTLAAYPYSNAHYGRDLWRRWGLGALWFETGLVALLALFAYCLERRRGNTSSSYLLALGGTTALMTLLASVKPSPLSKVAELNDGSFLSTVGACLALAASFYVPARLIARQLEQSRRR